MADTSLYIPVLEERKKFRDYRHDIWGDSFSLYWERKWEEIKYLCIHHTVTNPTNNPKQDVDYIAELHKRRGWKICGYHFIITADGMVWYVGDISTARANVADMNEKVIGVSLVGDFTKYNPTDEQILSAHDLCKFFLNDVHALSNICGKSWEDVVVGHSQLQATQCPGPAWKGPADSMFERIKNRIPYTPQSQPEPIIDWEKRYSELKSEFDAEKEKFGVEKEGLTTALVKVEKALADHTQECQQKTEDLEKKLENAKKENPKILDIKEQSFYSDNEIVGRAVEIVLERIKSKILFFLKKKEG